MWKLASKLDQTMAPMPAVSAQDNADALLLRRASEWMLAYWRRARGDQVLPASSALDDLFATEFGAFCVGGQIGLTEGPRVLRMGRHFTEAFARKDADRTGAFAAATMLGIVVGLAGDLQIDPRPVQRGGDFMTDTNRMVRYHAVAMPFRGGVSGVPAWLAAAEWRVEPAEHLVGRVAT
ncbi:MAG: hypothetical protein AB7M05_10855 [Alphaproteobacteria bacterium]